MRAHRQGKKSALAGGGGADAQVLSKKATLHRCRLLTTPMDDMTRKEMLKVF